MTPSFSWTGFALILVGSACQAGPLPNLSPSKPATAALTHAESGLSRLKSLIQSAEKALEKEDYETASTRSDEAELLMADWGAEVLQRSDIAALIARLQAVQRQLEVEEVSEDESGVKSLEEDINLTPDQLKTEREHAKSAGEGAIFDFPIDLNDKVLLWINVFSGRIKSKIEASLSRGSSYLPMIRQIFEEEGIPQDLAFLPLIESGYINKIKSYASAVGMWQFMPSTGRLFGLTQNAWVDERRDPVKATRAAARYLKQLYRDSGDWYLALAGYNNGPGRVETAASLLGTRNFWDMARSRHMRDQTKSYVPQFCAGVMVGRFPEKYSMKIEQAKPYAFETVEIGRSTRLNAIAKYAGLDLEELHTLNPELTRGITPPSRYVLRVPPGQGLTTARALTNIPVMERIEFKTYVIRKRDTLAKVASRFRLNPEELLQANDLRRSQFKPGRRIQIPPPFAESSPEPRMPDFQKKPEAAKSSRQSPEESTPLAPLPPIPGRAKDLPPAELPKPSTKPMERFTIDSSPTPTSKPKPTAKSLPRITYHRVKPGETLYSIAMRYGMDVKELKSLNGLRHSSIHPGQRLKTQRH